MSADLPTELDASGSILFLGSGFSRDARNIRGHNLPTGQELKNEFAAILGVDSNQYNLQMLTEEIGSRKDVNLYQMLYETFTVSEIQDHQSVILRLPWRRIYTTNYDDTIEHFYMKNKDSVPSFSYNDRKPRKLSNGSIIHLHGVIRATKEDDVINQLVMNETSYARQHFERSPWYDEFIRDLRFCHACFFVGYSLSDYHISAILLQDETLREKTYFVTSEKPDPIFANRIKPYGIILPIGLEKFAQLCRSLPAPTVNGDLHHLKAFKYLDPFKDKKTLSGPTAVEILNLVTYGTFNYERCLSTLPGGEYVVPRQRLAEEAVTLLRDARCLLVHSRIGNGKSIFLYILAHKLSEQGHRCFFCRTNPQALQQDLKLLQTLSNVIIFFDSYNSAIDIMEQFADQLPDVKFVVSVRTAIQEVRLHEMQSRLPSPLQRVNLNDLQSQDVQNFKILLDQSGVRAENLELVIDQCRDFREIVVTLYNNQEIRNKIKKELSPLLQDLGFREIFVASHLLKWAGQDVDPAFLRSVTLRDAYAEVAKFREISGDIFRLDDDNIHVRSAIFSEYLIQHHLTTQDILESVHKIIVQAVKRKTERRYQAILSSLMRFNTLNRALRSDPHRLGSLIALFERLRRDIDVNQEPLFWLQYSILMTEANDLLAAEKFIGTAYDRATASPGFRTFQIDTYALTLLLLIERSSDVPSGVTRFDKIIEKMERVRSMVGEESRRVHAVQAFEGVEPFVTSRVSALSITEMNALVYHLSLVVEDLDRLSIDARAQTGSEIVKYSVIRAKERILARWSTSK